MAEFASKGIAGSGLGLGIAGTALGVLNGGLGNVLGGLGGWGVNRGPYGGYGDAHIVDHYELDMTRSLANKDMEIAYWRGQDETNKKIGDAYAALERQINSLEREVRHNKEEQCDVNLQQAVYNGTNTAAVSCIRDQIAQLYGITKLVVPNSSVCPGWGGVSITPATVTTTTAVTTPEA